MEILGLIIVSIWIITKFLGGGSNNKGGLNNIEKYKTFDNFKKK